VRAHAEARKELKNRLIERGESTKTQKGMCAEDEWSGAEREWGEDDGGQRERSDIGRIFSDERQRGAFGVIAEEAEEEEEESGIDCSRRRCRRDSDEVPKGNESQEDDMWVWTHKRVHTEANNV
jgi:hypothetical protein